MRTNKLQAIFLSLTLILGVSASTLTLTGCPNQSQIAALTQVLGNDSAQIATIEGNPALAAQLKADTAAAVMAVNNWQKGTNAQMAIEAMNIVIADLNLIPNTGPYVQLIVLAIGTAQSIIALMQPPAPAPAALAKLKATGTAIPTTAKEFQKQWNAIIKANPQIQLKVSR